MPADPARFDRLYGVPDGTTARWIAAGRLPADPTEHEWLVAYLTRPSSAAVLDKITGPSPVEVPVPCPTTADPDTPGTTDSSRSGPAPAA